MSSPLSKRGKARKKRNFHKEIAEERRERIPSPNKVNLKFSTTLSEYKIK